MKNYLKLIVINILLVISGLLIVPRIKAAETLYYIHQDHLGSTALVTDSTGKVVSKQSYYPYGATRSQSSVVSSQPTERAYTGQVSDEDETGLYYYNARYYNPQIAKFTQSDTADALQNRYAYVGNNPIVLIDPSGSQQARFDEENPPDIARCSNCHSVPTSFSDVPDWYGSALSGDYSKVPPMGFSRPSEMFEFGKKYGLPLLFMRGEEGIRLQKAWDKFNSSLINEPAARFDNEGFPNRIDLYWSSEYNRIRSEFMEKYSGLNVKYFSEDDRMSGRVPKYAAAYYSPGNNTVYLPKNEYRSLTNIVLFTHETTHFIDDESYGIGGLDSEVNAYFSGSNMPYISELDINISRQTLREFFELRQAGFSDNLINFHYQTGNLDNLNKVIRLSKLSEIKEK